MIFLEPQVSISGDRIHYYFSDDTISVEMHYDGIKYVDKFNFNNVPDGKLELYDEDGAESVETTLPENVLLGAERVDGELSVKLLNWIDVDATYSERFPQWMDSREYEPSSKIKDID